MSTKIVVSGPKEQLVAFRNMLLSQDIARTAVSDAHPSTVGIQQRPRMGSAPEVWNVVVDFGVNVAGGVVAALVVALLQKPESNDKLSAREATDNDSVQRDARSG